MQRPKQSLPPIVQAAVALACLLVLGGVGYFVVYPYATAAYHERKADQALEDLDFAAAKERLALALAARPGSGEIQFRLARVCRRSGDYDGARLHLKEARRTYWDKSRLDLEQLLLQAQTGALAPVEPPLQAYLAARHPDEKEILEALINGHLGAKSPRDAYQWACLWLEHYPNDWRGQYWKGVALEAGLRYDKAAEEFAAALQHKPEHADTHLHLAEVLTWAGRFGDAAPHFRKYLESAPQDPRALLGLGRCERALGLSEAARGTVAALLAVRPDDAGGMLLRGQLELDADRPAEAIGWLRAAHGKAPNDLHINLALAATLRALDRPDEARAFERRGQEIRGDLKRMDEINKLVLANPRDRAARYEAGIISMRLGQNQEAAHWLVSAYLLDSSDVPTRKALAECLAKLGDPKLEKLYRRLLEDRATSPRRSQAEATGK